jgi:DnaJ-class molecular chaperone
MAQTNRQPTTSPKSAGTPRMNPGDEAPRGSVGSGESVCPACHGTGMVGGETCENCNGTGKITVGIGGA